MITKQHRLADIVGKPFMPKRNIKPWTEERDCTDSECKAPCFCTDMPRGHFQRDHTDRVHSHNVTVEPSRNGSGWLERKADGELVYHTPWTAKPKPFSLPPYQARIETTGKALERMRKECTAAALKEAKAAQESQAGKACPDGFRIVATNGHWALLEKGEGTGKPLDWLGSLKGCSMAVIETPEFWHAVQRARVMADERSQMAQIRADLLGHMWLYSSNSDSDFDAGDFVERIPTIQCDREWQVGLNCKYLEIPLGSWPITVWVKDSESQVVFEAKNRSWRFVIMPMRGGFEGLEKAVKEYQENEKQSEKEQEAITDGTWRVQGTIAD
jgi:hypothetical protein